MLIGLSQLCLLPDRTEAQDLDSFVGSYVHNGGAVERAARDRMVEALISEINLLLRPIARRRLPQSCGVPPRVEIRRLGETVAIVLAPAPPRTSRLDNSPVQFANLDGDRVSMRRALRRGAIVETLTRGRSRRIITYQTTSNNLGLRLRWRIESPYLPRSIAYPLSYRRVNP